MLAAPTTVDWVQGISSLITACGVLAAGSWALYNFGLRRISRPQVQIDARLISVRPSDSGYVVGLAVRATNGGHVGIRKKSAFVELNSSSRGDVASGIRRLNFPTLKAEKVYSIFERHTYLEPGEVFMEDLALLVPKGDILQIRVLLIGTNPRDSWTALRLVDLLASCEETAAKIDRVQSVRNKGKQP
jgi:hypothetical protein